ncbi:HNH endonuclease signature motif containing protein [Flammeovirga pacifica]|nr:HNH endonuclease signature motif containing protein [Flammeovirga pacifica]
MLYNFEYLKNKLDQLRFPEIQANTGFKIIKGVNFEKAYKEGSIQFDAKGIHLEYDGKSHKGYMFIKEPWIEKYGSYPKFHVTQCQTIQEFINRGNFKIRYEFSNSSVNDLIDKSSRNLYKDQALEMCTYCKKAIMEDIHTTEDFFDSLDKSEIESNNIEVDIHGYVKDKEKISRVYRSRHNYICEVCSIEPLSKMDRRWWHVHHVDGDKTNNSETNLKCLCIKCHSEVDERHILNFSKGTMKLELDAFKKKFTFL